MPKARPVLAVRLPATERAAVIAKARMQGITISHLIKTAIRQTIDLSVEVNQSVNRTIPLSEHHSAREAQVNLGLVSMGKSGQIQPEEPQKRGRMRDTR